MPSDLETLIREVLAEQAGRAPHRATVLAGMRWGTRRPYRRLAMVAAGVAVVLAAIGIPVGLHLTSHPQPAPPAIQPSPALATRPADIPIPYAVTWVPSGYVAVMRGGTPPGAPATMLQYWEPRDVRSVVFDVSSSTPYIELRYSRAAPDAAPSLPPTGAQDVSVNGAIGKLIHDTSGHARDGTLLDRAHLWWQPSTGVDLSVIVSDVPDPTDVAIRVARSVVSRSVGIPQALTFGYLPAGYSASYLQIAGTSATDFTVTRLAPEQDGGFGRYAAVWSTSRQSVTHPTAVTVRGLPGWFGQSPTASDEWGVVVQLDPGRWLAVWLQMFPADGSPPPVGKPADVVPIANGMSIYPDGSFDWLGR